MFHYHFIMFYEGISELVDHKMIEEWLEKNCNPKSTCGNSLRTNAKNFHNVIRHVKREEE